MTVTGSPVDWHRLTTDTPPRSRSRRVVHLARLVPSHGWIAACGIRLARGGAPTDLPASCKLCLRRFARP